MPWTVGGKNENKIWIVFFYFHMILAKILGGRPVDNINNNDGLYMNSTVNVDPIDHRAPA